MEFSLYEILSGIAMTLYLLRCWLTKTFDYWRKRKVSGPRPIPIFGSFKDVVINKILAADYLKLTYETYSDEPAVGLFSRSVPTLMLRDPGMIEDVLIKSFQTFPNRGLQIHKDIEPLEQHLGFLEYKRWKTLRQRLTPAFSSGKLQEMFYLIDECAEHFVNYIESSVTDDEPIECRELAAKYTTDVIGACAFGLNTNAMANDVIEFRKIRCKLFANSWTNKLRLLSRKLPHWFAVLLKPIIYDKKTKDFFVNIIKRTMEHRKVNHIKRHDFIDLLIDLQDHPEQTNYESTSDIFLTAQAFLLLAAGFETLSATMSHAMYELALNSDIQDKLRDEVNAAYNENNGKLSYEVVQNMKYLNQVFLETLRKYPPVFVHVREAADDHMFEDSRILISKGTKILIPVHAIHYDPNIYAEPEEFDPTRFEDESVKLRSHMTFLPFGHGPRNCIGERFSQIQTKLGLVAAIRHFKIETCEKTRRLDEKRCKSLLLIPNQHLYLKIKKVEKSFVAK